MEPTGYGLCRQTELGLTVTNELCATLGTMPSASHFLTGKVDDIASTSESIEHSSANTCKMFGIQISAHKIWQLLYRLP